MPKSDKYTPDMYRAYIRSLMIVIGGGKPAHGERDRWLQRISEMTGVSFRSLLAAWSGQWISRHQYVSKHTRERLEAVAENAKQTKTVVEFLELQIDIWETRPELYQRRVSLTRDFIARLREYDAGVPARPVRLAAKHS